MTQQSLQDKHKLAMRRLAATVTIVTTSANGKYHGMAATAVTSLSADPPSLLVCVNRTASIHDYLPNGGSFCVNILQPQHEDICMAFGGAVQPEDRFKQGAWNVDERGIPYLRDAAAQIFCDVSNLVIHGSHTVVIGDVYAVEFPDTGAPLIYGNGGFLRVA